MAIIYLCTNYTKLNYCIWFYINIKRLETDSTNAYKINLKYIPSLKESIDITFIKNDRDVQKFNDHKRLVK